MKRTIHKYAIPFASGTGEHGRFSIETHEEGKFLHVALQPHPMGGPVPVIWAEVDTDSKPETEELVVLGTGSEVPKGAQHLGTWLDGPFVWHLYALEVSR